MKQWVVACCVMAGTLGMGKAWASPYTEMIEGLRERQYFDYALLYLDQLAEKADLPAEIRQELLYERAMVLLDSSKVTRTPDKQNELLDQAQAFLEQFSKDNPNHPRAGDANSQRAEILLNKARVAILQARTPNQKGSKKDLQQKARTHIASARSVFETAQTQFDGTLKRMGSFIDKNKDPNKYELRETTLMQLIAAMLNVCQCRYEEAQTYDQESPEFKKLLNLAAEDFEKLHQRYRDYTGGLYARLYEGRCFDDMGDTQKAMGIYNELLEHDNSNRHVQKLQNVALQFKLEALNRKTPPDAEVVIALAAAWLKSHKSDSLSPVGLAIQWEQAVAYESLGDAREANKADKERNWRAARTAAQLMNRVPSHYRDVSLTMIQRIDGKLGSRDRKPEDFDSAFGLARQHFMTIQELRKELDASAESQKSGEERAKIEQDLHTEMHAAAQLFQTGINLADRNDDPKSVATARLWLAYVHYWARRNYEAAILAEYVAKTVPKDEDLLGIDAAYLAMVAYVQAYNDTKGPVDHKMEDLGLVIRSCEFLSRKWPESDRANDARMMAGRMYSQAKHPVEASAWFAKIPETDGHYAVAQLAAGQAFWKSYLNAARLDSAERPASEQLHEWQVSAQKYLRTGLDKLSATLPQTGTAPVDLITAKVSLAEILISMSQEIEAIAILTAEPHSVMQAITVAEESKRPATGIQNREFAVEVYKLLFRAYVGGGKLDDARSSMRAMEAIAGGGPVGSDITELYVGLGKLLKNELDRFRAAGELNHFHSLRTSFENFLNDVYERKEGHSLGSLSWIGETYSALGESATDKPQAVSYYTKSARAYQEILNQAQRNSSFATAEQLVPVQIRLAHSLRQQQDFSAAESILASLLQRKKDDLRIQIEAAELYRAWAAEPGQEKKYLLAVGGNPENQTLGYGPLCNRMLGVLRGKRMSPEEHATFHQRYLECRLEVSRCRYLYALTHNDLSLKKRDLNAAELEIMAFAAITKDIPDDFRQKFNALFQDVRKVLADPARPVQELAWASDLIIDPPDEMAEENPAKPAPSKQSELEHPATLQPGNPMLLYGMLGGGVVLGLGLMAWMFLRSASHRKPGLQTNLPERLSLDFSNVPTPRAKSAVALPTKSATNIQSTTKPVTSKALKPKPPTELN